MFLSKDEPEEREGSVIVPMAWDSEYTERVWPVGGKYRVIKHPSGRFGIQSYLDGGWWNMLIYDDGRDDYGKLHAARWKPLESNCMYTKDDLNGMIDRIRKASYRSSMRHKRSKKRRAILAVLFIAAVLFLIRHLRRNKDTPDQ